MSIWMWVLYTGLLTIILLLIITIIYYYYAKQKAMDVLSIQKWKIMNFNFGSYDSLPIEKILTLHNVMIFIKSVLDKDKNHYFL